MTVSVSAQALEFLLSCILGAGLGLLFDVFRIIRLAVKCGKFAVFFQDLLFLLVCTVVTFFFLLRESSGEIRIFIIGGEILGAALYYLTLGVLMMRLSRIVIDAIRRFKSFLMRHLLPPIRQTRVKIGNTFDKNAQKAKVMLKKENKLFKLSLKVVQKKMYNLIHIKKKHGEVDKNK